MTTSNVNLGRCSSCKFSSVKGGEYYCDIYRFADPHHKIGKKEMTVCSAWEYRLPNTADQEQDRKAKP